MSAVFDARTVELACEPLAADQVVEGDVRIGHLRLGEGYGVWEHSVGVSTDVEADEVFTVLAGRATVAFDDGRVLELAPGVVAELHAGERTTWTVTETLRKVYVLR